MVLGPLAGGALTVLLADRLWTAAKSGDGSPPVPAEEGIGVWSPGTVATWSGELAPPGWVVFWSVEKRRENLGLEVEWRVAMRLGSRWKQEPGSEEALREKAKASVRAKVEHPFLRLKRLFGYGKVRYRGLAKNMERLALLFGLGNLLTAEGQLTA